MGAALSLLTLPVRLAARAAGLALRTAGAAYSLTIGRPPFLVAALESAACVSLAACSPPGPLAALATVTVTQPWLWYATTGLGTLAGYAATAGVAFLAVSTGAAAGPSGRAGDADIAHGVAALVWGPLWWAGCAAAPALAGGRTLLAWGMRLAFTGVYASLTSAAEWGGPGREGGRGAPDGALWEGDTAATLPALAHLLPPGGDAAAPDLARVLGGGDLYAVLGVARDAPASGVRAGRARALRGCHPDKLGGGWSPRSGGGKTAAAYHAASTAAVERVTRAAALLAHEGRRAAYDARLAAWEAALLVTEGTGGRRTS
jgi:hypothetical protein